ncbi:MAG: 23S rRNA (cytidine1920-2'-O)/16S rRNA (cytidine1409-2'-O)-methyltransferase, partial [Myxococcota bacterium]
MAKARLDQRLVDAGLAPSRDRAKALILSGNVLVNDTPVTKAGTRVDTEATLRVKGASHHWVSRGALKLLPALEQSGVDPTGRICMDIGASTGGFTEVLLSK